jgi:multicomponent Na+:H+ antiporter subunit D
MNFLPALPVAIPLIVAAALAATASFPRRWIADIASLAAAVAVTALCALLLFRAMSETIVYWFGGWQPRDGIALGISFVIDPLGAGLATFAGLLMCAALIFCWRHFESVSHILHALMLVFLAAMVGFSLSGDLFNMFVFFELMTVSAIALTAHEIGERPPIEGALNFAITNTVGGFLVLSGIGLVYGRTGALNLAQIGETLAQSTPDRLVIVAFALLVAGFFVKAGVVPFHFWLADAYAVAPTPVCILFAGAMSELGLYAVARIYWTAFSVPLEPYEPGLQAVLLGVGILTALLGAIMCFLQHYLKRLLAFATVSYIGFFLIGIALLTADGLAGTAVYVLGDGLVKASLFVGVGVLQHRRGRVDELRLRGLGRDLPFTGAIFVVGGLALAALPPFGTFLGKSMIEEAALEQGYAWIPALFMLASILTGGAVLRAAGRVFLGWDPTAKSDPSSERADQETEPETQEARNRTPAALFAPALGLLLAGLAVGVMPGLAHAAQEAAARFLDGRAYADAVLRGLPAGQPPVGSASPPTGIDLLYAAGSTAGALALALLTLFGHRLPRRPPRALAAALGAGSNRLRALHSGHPGDYVAWLTLGVATLGGLFAVALY